jgi:2-ketocyclohexanecarboxyl-CoA hydrolase
MTRPAVLVDERNGVLRLTINRPERRNAYDLNMAETMVDALWNSHEVEAVVLSGAGGSFCAGGALGQLDDPDPVLLRRLFTTSLRLLDAIRSHPRPVLAAIDGAAAGGGNELVIAADFAVATARSTFGQTGPRVGSAPVLGATNLAAIQIGEKRAKEMTFLCRRYSADAAARMGLINDVVPDDGLDAAVNSWLAEIHALSPRYLEIAKVSSNLWWQQAKVDLHSSLEALIQAIGSDDMQEGARAFIEKRAPRFRDDWPGLGDQK